MRPPVGEWTPDVIQRLRTLWAEGISTAEIGNRLGFSKNAVVGKAHRLKLPGRPSPIQRERGIPRQPKVRRPVAPPAFTITTILPAPSANERVFERAQAVTPAYPAVNALVAGPSANPAAPDSASVKAPWKAPAHTARRITKWLTSRRHRGDETSPRIPTPFLISARADTRRPPW